MRAQNEFFTLTETTPQSATAAVAAAAAIKTSDYGTVRY